MADRRFPRLIPAALVASAAMVIACVGALPASRPPISPPLLRIVSPPLTACRADIERFDLGDGATQLRPEP
jgi:hypothetical protein